MERDFILAISIASVFFMPFCAWQFACIRTDLDYIKTLLKEQNK